MRIFVEHSIANDDDTSMYGGITIDIGSGIMTTKSSLSSSSSSSPSGVDDILDTMSLVDIGISCAVILIFCCSLIACIFVFLVFFKRPTLLTISNRFILNLSFCNLLNTVFVMPYVLVSAIGGRWLMGDIWCQITGFLTNAMFAASTLTLVVISIDRFCAVISPLHYKMRITRYRSWLMIFGVWSLAIAAALPPALGWNHFEYQPAKLMCTVSWSSNSRADRYYTIFLTLLCFVLPFIVMLLAYAVMFRSARSIGQRTRQNTLLPNYIDYMPGLDGPPLREFRRKSSMSVSLLFSRRLSTSSRSNSLLLWHREEWKAAVTSFLVVSTFVVCWLPYFIIIILESTMDRPQDIPPVVQRLAIVFALANSALNTMVYAFRNKVIRQQLCSILNKSTCSRETIRASDPRDAGSLRSRDSGASLNIKEGAGDIVPTPTKLCVKSASIDEEDEP